VASIGGRACQGTAGPRLSGGQRAGEAVDAAPRHPCQRAQEVRGDHGQQALLVERGRLTRGSLSLT